MMETTKKVIFAFRGDPMCFIHVLLNGLDLHERGLGGEIVIEGEAINLIPEMAKPGHFLHALYTKASEQKIIVGACRACAAKLKMTAAVEEQGLVQLDDISGHPSMGSYIERGYEVITF
jgi:hypothetical protein